MASTQKIIEEKNEKKLSNGHSQLLCKMFAKQAFGRIPI
jgi:hypothetical protein